MCWAREGIEPGPRQHGTARCLGQGYVTCGVHIASPHPSKNSSHPAPDALWLPSVGASAPSERPLWLGEGRTELSC